MSYEVIIPKPVQKQLKNLPPTINERVLEKFHLMKFSTIILVLPYLMSMLL
jgi:mRNA-degrading endonuclease RelE of RelBE toxin-antitoxin system